MRRILSVGFSRGLRVSRWVVWELNGLEGRRWVGWGEEMACRGVEGNVREVSGTILQVETTS